jgi:hypothetical protein
MDDINEGKSRSRSRSRSSGTGSRKRKAGSGVRNASLSPPMSLDNLVAAAKKLETRSPLTGGREEAIWGRDLLLIALTISNPLRLRPRIDRKVGRIKG